MSTVPRDRRVFPLPAPDEEAMVVRDESQFARPEPSAPEIVYELAEGSSVHASLPAAEEHVVVAEPIRPRRNLGVVIAVAVLSTVVGVLVATYV